jgi:hypothetical protein
LNIANNSNAAIRLPPDTGMPVCIFFISAPVNALMMKSCAPTATGATVTTDQPLTIPHDANLRRLQHDNRQKSPLLLIST